MHRWLLLFALVCGVFGGCLIKDKHHLPQECAAGCPTDKPVCSEVLEKCVACEEDLQCAGNDEGPYCDVAKGECVKCLEDGQCAATAETPVCDEKTRSCVQCVSDSDCKDEETPACHATSHQCVQCTKDNFSACGDFACKLADSSCTDTERGILDACDACGADMECIEGRKCVMHTFDGEELGSYCFLEAAETGCGDVVVERRPYRTKLEATSVDGVSAEYCFPPVSTTCQGISDTQSKVCASDAVCGNEGLDDGYCPSSGTGANSCSYLCTGSFDCGVGLECGGSPQHCRPPS